jgi:aminoglycoside 3-N-acetyltransferase
MTSYAQAAYDRDRLREDFVALGVEAGDTLFIHSSFKSIGPVEGGAESVVAALGEAVGPEGLVLMPSFNLVDWDERPRIWALETTPSTVGWLTEYFRLMPGTYRSDHYSDSVAARGKGAKEFVAGHLSQEGLQSRWDLEPWGRAYGTHSPMHRAYEAGGEILMLGVDYTTSTYIHLAEIMYRTRHLDGDTISKHPFTNMTKLGEWWDRAGRLSTGRVGNAECRLFGIRGYVDAVVQELESDVDRYVNHYL